MNVMLKSFEIEIILSHSKVNDPSKTYLTLPFGSVMNMANQELVEIARRSEPSVLRKRSFNGMSNEDWMMDVNSELFTRCPIVAYILSMFIQFNLLPEKTLPALCLIYGMIMFIRCHELSRIQRINTILLTQGQASKNVSVL